MMKALSRLTKGVWLTASVLFALALCPQAFADSVSYGYDSLNRLTSVTYDSGVTITYTYDAAGNRTSTTRSVSVPGAPTAVSETAGNESITVNFGAPASDGGAPITGYSANCTSSDGGVAGSNTGGASATSIVVGGLTNSKTYTCTVTASNSAGTGTAAVSANTVTPGPIAQSISFGAAPRLVVGGTGTVSATGGASGNPVTFSSTTPSICTLSGNTVTGIAAGTCTVAANQAGNAAYSAAPQVTQSFAVIDSAAVFAYITNAGSNTVSVIDTASNTLVATVAVGSLPYGVAVNPAGTQAYVANNGSNTVSVIDIATQTVIATVAVGSVPYGIALNPIGTRAYVTNDGENSVSVIDTQSNAVIATIAVGTHPRGIAVNPDGTRVYVANAGSDDISVIETATNTVLTTIVVGAQPFGIAVNTDGTRVYVTNPNSNNVAVIDTAMNTVIATVAVGNTPFGVALNSDGTRAYVTNANSNNVSVIDTATNTALGTVAAGDQPWGVALNSDGTRAYVVNNATSSVSVIDTATNTVVATVPVGANPVAFGQFVGGLGGGALGAPICTLSASPATIAAGGSATLTATCNPAATSYAWTNTGFAASASTGSVSPTATTTYSVIGSNEAGAGNRASRQVTVAACNYSIAPTSTSVSAGATTGTVGVTALPSCAWSVTSDVAWLTITSGGSGSGNGTVGYAVAANPGSSSRMGNVTVAGRTFSVTQAGNPCSYSISPTTATLPSTLTEGLTIAVTAAQGCAWTAQSNVVWLWVTASPSGSGNGQVTYSVALNSDPLAPSRTGTMTIAGQTFTATQPSTVTLPGAPTSVSATPGNARATVSFTPPASDGNSGITSYTVTSSPGGITASAPSSPITVYGLTNGTAYTFTVQASNAAGLGPASAPSNSVTPTSGVTVPCAPTAVSATAGNARATVSFAVPPCNGGSGITSYTLTSSPGGITASRYASPITVWGLTNGTAYTFTVQARNAMGYSEPSAPSNSVTPHP